MCGLQLYMHQVFRKRTNGVHFDILKTKVFPVSTLQLWLPSEELYLFSTLLHFLYFRYFILIFNFHVAEGTSFVTSVVIIMIMINL